MAPTAAPEVGPPCRVQQPGLPDAMQYLVGVLQHRPTLTSLDLSGCQLSEATVTYLCVVLQDAGCQLQTLR